MEEMSSNNLVTEITTFDELLTINYGEEGSLEREKFHAKSQGWASGYQDGYKSAVKDMQKKMKKLLKKLNHKGDE